MYYEPKEDENVFDVDAIEHRDHKKSGIRNDTPKSAEGWHKKFEKEDEHIRKMSS